MNLQAQRDEEYQAQLAAERQAQQAANEAAKAETEAERQQAVEEQRQREAANRQREADELRTAVRAVYVSFSDADFDRHYDELRVAYLTQRSEAAYQQRRADVGSYF